MLHAFVQRDLAFALGADGILDDVEHVRSIEPERLHVGPGDEQDLECLGPHRPPYASACLQPATPEYCVHSTLPAVMRAS